MFNKKIKERTIYIDEAFKEHSEENTDFKYEEKRTTFTIILYRSMAIFI